MIEVPDAALAAVSLAVLALLGFGARTFLKSWIEGQVRQYHDVERAKSESALRLVESRLSELSGFAIAAEVKNAALLQERRLNAIDSIWGEVGKLARFRFQVSAMQIIKLEEMAAAAPKDESIRTFAKTLCSNLAEDEVSRFSQLNARIYVSERLWGAYDAYSTVMVCAYGILKALENGLPNADKLFDWSKINAVLKLALPHQEGYIEKYPKSAAFYLADELEANLLNVIRAELSGEQPTTDAIAKAAKMIELAETLRQPASPAVQ